MKISNKKKLIFIFLALISLFLLYVDDNEHNKPDKAFDVKPQQIKNIQNISAKKVVNTIPAKQVVQSTNTSKCFAPLLSPISTLTNVESEPVRQNTQKNYFELLTNLDDKSGDFTSELKQKLLFVFQKIENDFDFNLTRKLDLNIVYRSNPADYNDFILHLGRSAEGSAGVYLFPEHISVVAFTSYEQAIKTSIHEAIHAFNRSYWGESLRFFNEGMAEYFENIFIDGEIAPFDFSGLQDQKYPMEIENLLFSETDWHGDNNHKLYLNSNALFHFLMSHQEGRNLIWEIMKLEKEEPCSPLSEDKVIEILFEMYPNHQQAFDYWFTDGLAVYNLNSG